MKQERDAKDQALKHANEADKVLLENRKLLIQAYNPCMHAVCYFKGRLVTFQNRAAKHLAAAFLVDELEHQGERDIVGDILRGEIAKPRSKHTFDDSVDGSESKWAVLGL